MQRKLHYIVFLHWWMVLTFLVFFIPVASSFTISEVRESSQKFLKSRWKYKSLGVQMRFDWISVRFKRCDDKSIYGVNCLLTISAGMDSPFERVMSKVKRKDRYVYGEKWEELEKEEKRWRKRKKNWVAEYKTSLKLKMIRKNWTELVNLSQQRQLRCRERGRWLQWVP